MVVVSVAFRRGAYADHLEAEVLDRLAVTDRVAGDPGDRIVKVGDSPCPLTAARSSRRPQGGCSLGSNRSKPCGGPPMRIRSIASSIPTRRVSTEEIVERVRQASASSLTPDQMEQVIKRLWTLFRLAGSRNHYERAMGERSGDFVLNAAREALKKADLLPGDIDLVLYVGVGRGWVEPGTSNYFTHALGLWNATCFDVLDACLSWLRALYIAYQFLKNGAYKHILVLNGEFNSEYADWTITDPDQLDYRFAQCTIGEAATATILERREDGEEPYFEFKTDASLHPLCKIPLPHIAQYSDGEKCPSLDPLVFFAYSRELFQAARGVMTAAYRNSAELNRRPFDIAFAHSASRHLIEGVDQELGGLGRTVNLFEEFGNTVSASIPVAMCRAIEQGRLRRGMRMLHVVGSAGFSVGFGHLVY
jgi:3-oxoacyl-[acyl-carrier-protein] synthase III